MIWAVAAVGLAGMGAFVSAKNAQTASAYNRDVALMNKKIAEDNAEDVRKRGRVAVYDQRRATARAIGVSRARSAGRGIVVDQANTVSGDEVNSLVAAGELDVLRLKNNIENEERRALVQAANFEAEAGAFEIERKANNPYFATFMSAAQTATRVGAAGGFG